MYAVDTDFRQAADRDSVRWVDGLERAQELARACPDSRMMTVCDREGDFRELLSRAEQSGAALLVGPAGGRSVGWRWPRARRGPPGHVLGTEPVGGRKIEVPAAGDRTGGVAARRS